MPSSSSTPVRPAGAAVLPTEGSQASGGASDPRALPEGTPPPHTLPTGASQPPRPGPTEERSEEEDKEETDGASSATTSSSDESQNEPPATPYTTPTHPLSVTFDGVPIGEGQFRVVFKGHLTKDPSHIVAVKVWKEGCPMELAKVKPDLDVADKAIELAELWNADVVPRGIGAHQVFFRKPTAGRHTHSGAAHVKGQWSVFEDFLEGDYVKYNSNAGFETGSFGTPGAFSHWTYDRTGHKYLVADMQGVFDGKTYQLTDPAIHSFANEFKDAQTDLGVVGMEKVLAGHRCNSVCRKLKLPAYRGPRWAAESGRKRTTMKLDLDADEMDRVENSVSSHVRLVKEEPLDVL